MAAHKRIATLLGLVAAATAVPRVEQRLSAADLVISTFDGAKGTSQARPSPLRGPRESNGRTRPASADPSAFALPPSGAPFPRGPALA